MKNKFKVEGSVVTMLVQDKCVTFDFDDLQKLERFSQWKLTRWQTVCADYRDNGKMVRILLHKLLTGSRFVKWINGDKFDFRKENIVPIEKSIHPRPCGNYLKGNKYRIESDFILVYTKSKGIEYEILVDCNDYPLISKYTWYVNPSTGYVQTRDHLGRSVNRQIYMHRLVMGVYGMANYVDHINGNKLDNRRSNLRICSPSQNGHNKHLSSGRVVGVTKVVPLPFWEARIQVNNVQRSKSFKTYEEAIAQRRAWEKELNPSGLNGKGNNADARL